MKQYYIFALGLFACTSIFAQQAPQQPASERQAVPMVKRAFMGNEVSTSQAVQAPQDGKTKIIQTKSAVIAETIIGLTQYDLQSNGAVQNRLAKTGNQLSAAWTMSLNATPFADRGTGYNFGDNGSWDEEPFARLESDRVGWPSMIHTAGGKEIAITHAAFAPLNMVSRDVNSGSWSESSIPTDVPDGMLWPRATAGGEDGNSLHVIAITTPVANDGAVYQGVDGAILYYRSLDQGETWDIQDLLLPQLDSTQFLGFDGDSYAIHARGNKVAFAVFGDLMDSFVMISEDNGDTWTYTSLVDFPVDLYEVDAGLPEIGDDWNEDGLFQEFFNTDGAGAILIDQEGQVHVTYGEMYYMDDDLTDTNFSYFPGVNGLRYWNEGFGPDSSQTIAYTYDLDESGALELEDDLPLYFVGLSALPSMGCDEANNLYVSYHALMESHTNGTQNFRHIYVVNSQDGGTTWSTENACDLTPDEDFDEVEYIFASMAPDVDDNIHIIYQRDFEPGLHVRGDEDPVDVNDIVYLEMPVASLAECLNVSVDEVISPESILIYPNPSEGQITLVIHQAGASQVNVLDLTGKMVYSRQTTNIVETHDLSELSTGIYILQVQKDGQMVSKKLIIE
jgi:hypothetical protein